MRASVPTHTRRQRGGVATAVADRAAVVIARADLDPSGRAVVTVPDGGATVAGYSVQRSNAAPGLPPADDGRPDAGRPQVQPADERRSGTWIAGRFLANHRGR